MRADGYRYKAERCLTRARLMVSSDARRWMFDLAAYWMRLAEQAERKPGSRQRQHIQDRQTR
jgi:hypothetical protein